MWHPRHFENVLPRSFPARCLPSAHVHLSGQGRGNDGDEADDGGQERSQEAVAEAGQDGAQGGDEAGQQAGEEADEGGQEAGEQGEDGGEEEVELRLDAEDGEEAVDGGQDELEQGGDEGQDAVDVAVADGEAGGGGQAGDDLGELELDVLDLGEGLGLALLGGEAAGVDELGDVGWRGC